MCLSVLGCTLFLKYTNFVQFVKEFSRYGGYFKNIINIFDITLIDSFLYREGPPPFCLKIYYLDWVGSCELIRSIS